LEDYTVPESLHLPDTIKRAWVCGCIGRGKEFVVGNEKYQKAGYSHFTCIFISAVQVIPPVDHNLPWGE
jgi:hypothetical protein